MSINYIISEKKVKNIFISILCNLFNIFTTMVCKIFNYFITLLCKIFGIGYPYMIDRKNPTFLFVQKMYN